MLYIGVFLLGYLLGILSMKFIAKANMVRRCKDCRMGIVGNYLDNSIIRRE